MFNLTLQELNLILHKMIFCVCLARENIPKIWNEKPTLN